VRLAAHGRMVKRVAAASLVGLGLGLILIYYLPTLLPYVDSEVALFEVEQPPLHGKGRTFPFDVLPELDALVRAQRAYTDAVERRTGQIVRRVFHRNGRRVKSIRQAWRTACKRAGLVGLIPHDFRRTAVRRLERANVPRSVAMQLVGHQSEAIYRRYAITNEADLREGLARVPGSRLGTEWARRRGGIS